MTGANHILRKVVKCATIAARQMCGHVAKTSLRGVPYRGNSDVPTHGEQLAKRFFAFRGQCFVVQRRGKSMTRAVESIRPTVNGGTRQVGGRWALLDAQAESTPHHIAGVASGLHHKAPFFLTPNDARTQLGLHGLTRQETPSRDTPRAVRPNLAQVSVTLLTTQVDTRSADKANGPSRALGFFAAFLGPLAPIALNSGAREALEPRSIHPRRRHLCGVSK